jgi:hypothetical protein
MGNNEWLWENNRYLLGESKNRILGGISRSKYKFVANHFGIVPPPRIIAARGRGEAT